MKFKVVSDKNRKITLNWEAIEIYASRYKPHTPFNVEIVRRNPKRSDPMRKMYFAYVLKPLCEWSGYEPDEILEVHKYLKGRYFNIKPDHRGIYRNCRCNDKKCECGGIPSVFSNESEIEVPEKKKFVDWVIRIAAKSGCYIDLEKNDS